MFPAARHTLPILIPQRPRPSSYTVSRDNRVKIKRQIESFGPSTGPYRPLYHTPDTVTHSTLRAYASAKDRVRGTWWKVWTRHGRFACCKHVHTQTRSARLHRSGCVHRHERDEEERGRSNELVATWFSTDEKTGAERVEKTREREREREREDGRR